MNLPVKLLIGTVVLGVGTVGTYAAINGGFGTNKSTEDSSTTTTDQETNDVAPANSDEQVKEGPKDSTQINDKSEQSSADAANESEISISDLSDSLEEDDDDDSSDDGSSWCWWPRLWWSGC